MFHRGVRSGEAAVSITFRHAAEGKEHRYEVARNWSATADRIRERVRVVKDGLLDQYLSDNWNDLVEELIRSVVSQLFFFDAERSVSLPIPRRSLRRLDAQLRPCWG